MRFSKAILGLVIGSAAVTAWAGAGPGFGPGLFGMGGEGGDGHGGHHYHGHGHDHGQGHGRARGPVTPEQMDARIDRMAERLVKSVYGSAEQQAKVSSIAKAAARDLRELRKQASDLRRQGMDLLKAPVIDRAAIEALRSQHMAVADAISKRIATALADTAEVFTPEQRTKLAEWMQSRRAKRG